MANLINIIDEKAFTIVTLCKCYKVNARDNLQWWGIRSHATQEVVYRLIKHEAVPCRHTLGHYFALTEEDLSDPSNIHHHPVQNKSPRQLVRPIYTSEVSKNQPQIMGGCNWDFSSTVCITILQRSFVRGRTSCLTRLPFAGASLFVFKVFSQSLAESNGQKFSMPLRNRGKPAGELHHFRAGKIALYLHHKLSVLPAEMQGSP